MKNLAGRMGDERGALVRRSVEAVLVMLVLVQLVRLGLILIGTDAQAAAARVESVRPIDIGILARFDPFNREAGLALAPMPATPGLKLFGLRSGPGGGAILAGADGVQRSFGVGQEIEPGLVLSSVQTDHVILTRGGQTSRVYFENSAAGAADAAQAAAPPPPPPPPPSASPAPQPASLGGAGSTVRGIDLARLGQEAGLTPVEGGGFALAPRGGGALLALAGLRAGDVITAVDGQPLTGDSGDSLARQLAGRTSARLTFLRNGRQQTVTLQVPGL
jgi:general secretion pathway protein C